MKTYITVLLLLMAHSVSSQYWRYKNPKKRNGIENYSFLKAGWPHDVKCSVYTRRAPVKSKYVRRLKKWKGVKTVGI